MCNVHEPKVPRTRNIVLAGSLDCLLKKLVKFIASRPCPNTLQYTGEDKWQALFRFSLLLPLPARKDQHRALPIHKQDTVIFPLLLIFPFGVTDITSMHHLAAAWWGWD